MTKATAFDQLARPIQKWIRAQGWAELRPLQVRATQAILGGESDQIIAASTAGGKTEAAFLPLISQVLTAELRASGFDLLYIGPLKALITDQARRLADICQEAELPVVPWHGDIAASTKARALKHPAGILLITPESLEALFIRRGPEIPRLFAATKAVVIDELHTMLDSERGVQLRSLLNRLDSRVGRRLRRIGLSATLGDMALACACLNPDDPAAVGQIEVKGGGELRVQLRGYVSGGATDPSPTDAIASHLFQHLRGSDNLVFGGSRQSVEIYADRLRLLCEAEALPQEFYPHHASLSRDHRDFVEKRLKDGRLPTTAICTSTLELGIDIGDVNAVAQIGAPFSVASLRQRLGRSGRRAGRPAILRQYAVESALDNKASFADQLRLGLLRATAMIELLIEGWCEPPQSRALHLSTLVHQILSVVAERGGIRAPALYELLCRQGPFFRVDKPLFAAVLRAIGHPDRALLEQARDGLLLLGRLGEKLVEHYSFYAVFQTPEEFRILHGSHELGTLPIDNILAPGMLLIFSGRRWLVQSVHSEDKAIMVTPAHAGVPPTFGGDGGQIHDRVIARMFNLLAQPYCPPWLDTTAKELLQQARSNYARMLFKHGVLQLGKTTSVVATACGTVRTTTLALALRSFGYQVQQYDGFLELSGHGDPCEQLRALANDTPPDLWSSTPTLLFEKFHPWLTPELLQTDALSSRLDLASLAETCRRILAAPSM